MKRSIISIGTTSSKKLEYPKSDKKKYQFKGYYPIYPRLYKKEEAKIRKLFPKTTIEHVGSTSVPGLGGKGIIDIAIQTPKSKLKNYRSNLETLGFEYSLEHPGNDKRIFLQKRIRYGGKERLIHIHLTLDNDFWNSFIVFRDYLRNNNKERDKYAKIKREAVKHAKGEGKKYREYKNYN